MTVLKRGQSGSLSNVIPLNYSINQSDSLKSQSAAKNQRTDGLAVLYLDLDRYKILKYNLGHLLADELVAATARRLQNCLGKSAIFAHVGADEFAILLPNIEKASDAIAMADRIHKAMQAPFKLSDRPVIFSTASIGVVFSELLNRSAEELFTAAATAMNHAQVKGQGKTELFDPQMQRSAIESLHMEVELKKAIQLEQLHLNYQPIVCPENG